MVWRVGLTGGVASGKSTVAEAFRKRGIEVVDADHIARELTEPGQPALERIRAAFGDTVFTPEGRLNRRRLRAEVFARPEARRRLEVILHPAIRAELLRRTEAARSPYVILVVPLLVESGWHALVDRVLVVDLPEAEQIRRLCRRDHIAPVLARAMLAAQTDRRTRLAVADDRIDNSGPPEDLEEAVEALHRRYLQMSVSGGKEQEPPD